jgi:hypothetical protein
MRRRPHPLVKSNLPQIVAVVERWDAHAMELQHRLDVPRHGCARLFDDQRWILDTHPVPLLEAPAAGQVAVHGIVGGSLIRDRIRLDAPAQQLGQHLAGISQQTDRNRLTVAPGAREHRERFIQRLGLHVEVARLQPLGDTLRAALDG